MAIERVKVLFIAGWGRSGSTLLDMLLGQIEGFFSAGEVRYVWDRGMLENRPCGCSKKFVDCAVWGRVAAPWIEAGRKEIERVVGLRDGFRTRHLWHGVTKRGRRRIETKLEDYSGQLGRIYQRLHETTGCRVIVDSSKFPSHGYVAGLIPQVDLYVAHLIRDPRAVAFSWNKKKIYDTADGVTNYIPPHSPSGSSQYWVSWNLLSELQWGRGQNCLGYVRLRYEDFIRNPRQTLLNLTKMMEEPATLDFLSNEATARMKPSHAASGNPARFKTGPVKLEEDKQWQREMPRWNRFAVTCLTLPLLHRYGYLANGRHAPAHI